MKTRVHLAALILLSLLGATGVDQDTQWDPAAEGCRVSLSTNKSEYFFGESIDITAAVQNLDRENLQVEGNHLRFPYRFELYGPNSEEIPLTLWGRAIMKPHGGSIAFTALSKGQSRVDAFSVLNRAFDLTLEGKYALVIHRTVPSALDPHAWIDLVSNTVIFEIKNPKTN
jgi:hypothetical protein